MQDDDNEEETTGFLSARQRGTTASTPSRVGTDPHADSRSRPTSSDSRSRPSPSVFPLTGSGLNHAAGSYSAAGTPSSASARVSRSRTADLEEEEQPASEAQQRQKQRQHRKGVVSFDGMVGVSDGVSPAGRPSRGTQQQQQQQMWEDPDGGQLPGDSEDEAALSRPEARRRSRASLSASRRTASREISLSESADAPPVQPAVPPTHYRHRDSLGHIDELRPSGGGTAALATLEKGSSGPLAAAHSFTHGSSRGGSATNLAAAGSPRMSPSLSQPLGLRSESVGLLVQEGSARALPEGLGRRRHREVVDDDDKVEGQEGGRREGGIVRAERMTITVR